MSRASADYLIRKGSVITLITLISRPLGYIREAVQAYLFGATVLVDAFVVSFNFPEMIQNLFFTGATSAFLIPVCSRYMGNREEFSHIYTLFINLALLVTGIVSVFFLIFSTPVVALIAPGFSDQGAGFTEGRLLDVSQYEQGPLPGEKRGASPAYSAGGSCNYGHLAFESSRAA